MNEELLSRAVVALEKLAQQGETTEEIAKQQHATMLAAVEQQRIVAANSNAYEARARAYSKTKPTPAKRQWWAFW